MNALDIDLIRKSAREHAPANRSTAHSLARMTSLQVARRTVIFTVDAAAIATLMDRARADIPGLTKCEIFQAAVNHNPDIFWAIARKERFDINEPKGEGFLAVLPLNHEGMRRLIDGLVVGRCGGGGHELGGVNGHAGRERIGRGRLGLRRRSGDHGKHDQDSSQGHAPPRQISLPAGHVPIVPPSLRVATSKGEQWPISR